jgi:general secretion pathway protein A
MYTTYFGLTEKPFSLTPDPRFLYLSERHAEALAHLQYGILEGGGFIQLTGEVGTGKTTLTRTLLARLPEEIDLALILNPRLNVRELLVTICEELGLDGCADASDNKTLIDRLNARLIDAHKRGHRAVLLIDEAQNLEIDVLEQLRLLTNLETETTKLLQIILIGQPELRATLARTDLRQLAQRITGRYHLAGLDVADTSAYVRHRLAVAGAEREIFTSRALIEVHRLAGGTPRLINVICDRALLGAYTAEQSHVTPKLVREAAREIGGAVPVPTWRSRTALAGAVAACAAILLGVGWWRLADPLDAAAPVEALPGATVDAVVPAATAAARTAADAAAPTPALCAAVGRGRADHRRLAARRRRCDGHRCCLRHSARSLEGGTAGRWRTALPLCRGEGSQLRASARLVGAAARAQRARHPRARGLERELAPGRAHRARRCARDPARGRTLARRRAG